MITGELKSQIDQIWNTFWTGGITNTITIVEQLTYLIFIKDLDETEIRNQLKASVCFPSWSIEGKAICMRSRNMSIEVLSAMIALKGCRRNGQARHSPYSQQT